MSAPVRDDDKRNMYAPPWARQMPDGSPDDVEAAVGRLRREPVRLTTAADRERDRDPLRERIDGSIRDRGAEVDDRIQERVQSRVEGRLEGRVQGRIRGTDRDDVRDRRDLNTSLFQDRVPARSHWPTDDGDVEAEAADIVRDAWSPPQLEPVPVPPPPKPNLGDAPWGMIARMGGAVVVAAVIALTISGALQRSSFDFWPSRQEVEPQTKDAAQGFRGSAPILQATTPSDVPAAGAVSSGVLSALAPVDVAVAAPAPAPSPAVVEVASAKTEEPSKRSETRTIGRDEIDGLLKRGQALLKDGDIAAARLVLRRAAEAGDANAMLMLAGSYDRAELMKLKVFGVAPDHAQAKAWYAKAVELGSAEAVRRLQQHTQRAD